MSKKKRLGSDPLGWIKDTRQKEDTFETETSGKKEAPDHKAKEGPKDQKIKEALAPAPSDEIVSADEQNQAGETFQEAGEVNQEFREEQEESVQKDGKISPEKGNGNHSGGKFLTFFLEEEEYGVEILKVMEIIGLMDITPVPRTPGFIRGVINLRGKIVPIMDLRARFGLGSTEKKRENVIIVVKSKGIEMGLFVDKVSDVSDIDGNNIEDTPDFGHNVNSDYILCIGKSEDKVKLILDIDNIISVEGFSVGYAAEKGKEIKAQQEGKGSSDSSPAK